MKDINIVKKTIVKGALRTPVYEQELKQLSAKKGTRSAALDKSIATNTIGQTIDADEVSMDRLDRVISVGVANILLKSDPTNPLWSTTVFDWVDSNNNPITIKLKDAIELQSDGLNKIKNIWFGK